MLSGLTILVEASLELTTSGGDDKATEVSESGTHDHVRDVVFMTWRVKDCILFCCCVDDGSAHLHSLTLCLLLIGAVHDVGQPPRVSTLVLRLLLELLNRSLVDDAHRVDQVTTDG